MRTLNEWMRRLNIGSAQSRLEWYPPFRSMRVKVVELALDNRTIRLRLPLNRHNRNPGGGMFGGAMAALADPIPALMCSEIFPGYGVWTRALHIDFRREARCDVELLFTIDDQQMEAIKQELSRRGRADPQFEYGLFRADGSQCVWVKNTVAMRPLGARGQGDSLRSHGIVNEPGRSK